MNNVVLTSNTFPNRPVFNEFSNQTNYYYMPNQTETVTETEIKKKKHGKTIALSAIAIGFGLLTLTKGSLSKQLTKILEKWKNKLEAKSGQTDELQKIYHHSIAKIESYMNKTESINNFTTLKDVLFQKLMCGKDGNRRFTSKIHKGITKIFAKISRKTVNNAYASTQGRFATLNENIASINERLLKENPSLSDTIETINRHISRVNSNLDKGFGINARNARHEEMKKATDGLFEYFWKGSLNDFKNFRSKEMWQTFIADTYLVPTRKQLAKDISVLRNGISHNIGDIHKGIISSLDEIQKCCTLSDTKTNQLMQTLRNNLSKYKNLSGANEAAERSTLTKEILANLSKLKETPPTNNKDVVGTHINTIENILTNSSKGELEKVLSIYKNILPKNEYANLKSQVEKAVKSLDNSINIETVKYFDKYRDLRLGSAPTDIVSILGTVGTIGWFLGKADNKDDRISASLKYGIPAIGTIATSLYGTAKLIAGGKALAFGLISGWLISKLGTSVDEMRKKYSLDVSLENKTLLKAQSDTV